MPHPTPPTDPVDGIRKALDAGPTDSEWVCDIRHGEMSSHAYVRAPNWGIIATIGLDRSLPHWDVPQRANAQFIASCKPSAIRALLDRLDSAERALRNVKRVIGPCVPECSGCYEEWSEALRIIDAAIDEQLRSVGEKEPK